VLDPVGGERFTDSLRSLSVEGRLIVVGFASGEIPVVKVNRLLFNNLDVIGAGWGAFLAHDAAYVRQQWEEMRPMVGDGRLSPLVGATFPLEKAADALREIGERRATGKVVLRAG
jgi:NADPH2:quinone reductase